MPGKGSSENGLILNYEKFINLHVVFDTDCVSCLHARN